MVIQGNDPYRQPSFSRANRLRRAAWQVIWLLLFRASPRPMHAWRAFLLRTFGAKIGKGSHVYPGVRVWAPWNLKIGDFVGVADGVTIYSMDQITIGDFAVVSQGSYLCGGTHDYNSRNFQLVVKPIVIGRQAWVCAEAFIHPGVCIPEGTVVGARSVVTKSPQHGWAVYAGNPCRQVAARVNHAPPEEKK